MPYSSAKLKLHNEDNVKMFKGVKRPFSAAENKPVNQQYCAKALLIYLFSENRPFSLEPRKCKEK